MPAQIKRLYRNKTEGKIIKLSDILLPGTGLGEIFVNIFSV